LRRSDSDSAGRRRDTGAPADAALLPAVRAPGRSRWRRPAIIGAGGFLILLGIPGIVLPILPGWLLIGIGLVVLSQEVHTVRRLLHWLRRRFPGLARRLAAEEARFRRIRSWTRGRP
jgi:hypothetical protein